MHEARLDNYCCCGGGAAAAVLAVVVIVAACLTATATVGAFLLLDLALPGLGMVADWTSHIII